MNIRQKIEAIRKEPEHVRVRYVWILTGVCMFFVILIWIFSLKQLASQKQGDSLPFFGEDGQKAIKDLQNEGKELKNMKDNLGDISQDLTGGNNSDAPSSPASPVNQ